MRAAHVLLIACAIGPSAMEGQQWKPFRSAECRCSALFPGKPVGKTETTQTKLGPVEQRQFRVVVADKAMFGFICAVQPGEVVRAFTSEDILRTMTDSMVKSSKGRLVAERDVSLKGYAGREIEMEISGKVVSRSRVFVVAGQVYTVVAATVKGSLPDAGRFLDSFEFEVP